MNERNNHLNPNFALQENEPFNVLQRTRSEVLSEFNEKYPVTEWWRLLVDGRLYDKTSSSDLSEEGWLDYENRETHSIRSFLMCLRYDINHIMQPGLKVTIEFIQELKSLVEKDIHNLSGGQTKGQFRENDEGVFFHLINEKLSVEGLEDLLNQIENGYLKDAVLELSEDGGRSSFAFITSIDIDYVRKSTYNCNNNSELASLIIEDNMQKEFRIKYHAPEARVTELVQNALDDYYAQIEGAQSLDQKLEILGKTISRLDRIHPFFDANIRTFAILLLNYFLIAEMGLPPATLYDPNLFDAFGHEAGVIKRGILNTLSVYHAYETGSPVNLFGLESMSLGEEAQQKMDKIINSAQAHYENYIQNKQSLSQYTSTPTVSSHDSSPIQNIEEIRSIFYKNMQACLQLLNSKEKPTLFKSSKDDIDKLNLFLKNLNSCHSLENIMSKVKWDLGMGINGRSKKVEMERAIIKSIIECIGEQPFDNLDNKQEQIRAVLRQKNVHGIITKLHEYQLSSAAAGMTSITDLSPRK